MIVDILIILPCVAFAALGFRDASVRKLTAIGSAILAMFIAQLFMHDLGRFLVSQVHVQPESAPVEAFSIIFFFLMLLQSVLYHFLTDNYKIGGGKIIDRIIGVALGLVEGVLIMSVLIFIMTMQGPPSRRTIWDSRLYHPTASVAPQIMDFFSSLIPAAENQLDRMASPEEGKADSTLNAPRQ